jgi:hypothetical protein
LAWLHVWSICIRERRHYEGSGWSPTLAVISVSTHLATSNVWEVSRLTQELREPGGCHAFSTWEWGGAASRIDPGRALHQIRFGAQRRLSPLLRAIDTGMKGVAYMFSTKDLRDLAVSQQNVLTAT